MSSSLILIALTAVVSWSAWQQPRLLERLLFWSPAVTRGREVERFVTYGLVHADFQHLLFNMVTLYFFGRLIEEFINQQIGDLGFVFFYVSALIVSIFPSWMKHRDDPTYRSLGASGAVSAVLFAFILLQPWSMIIVFVLPVPAILYAVFYVGYSLYMQKLGQDDINHSAHLWGAVYGVTFIVAMQPRVLSHFLSQLGLG